MGEFQCALSPLACDVILLGLEVFFVLMIWGPMLFIAAMGCIALAHTLRRKN